MGTWRRCMDEARMRRQMDDEDAYVSYCFVLFQWYSCTSIAFTCLNRQTLLYPPMFGYRVAVKHPSSFRPPFTARVDGSNSFHEKRLVVCQIFVVINSTIGSDHEYVNPPISARGHRLEERLVTEPCIRPEHP